MGSLVQLCCGEGGTLQTNITSMCRECSQCTDHTRFAPAHSCMCFPCLHCSGSKVLCRALSKVGPGFCVLSCSGSGSRVLHKGTDSVGCAFCALPRFEQLRQPGAWRVRCPRWAVRLSHLPGPRRLCVSSGELISDCDTPGRCQSSRIPGRLG